jgi:hypothetical protein
VQPLEYLKNSLKLTRINADAVVTDPEKATLHPFAQQKYEYAAYCCDT